MSVSGTAPLVEKWSNDFSAVDQQYGPAWMLELRETAAAQFGAAGLPNRKTEAWKYTSVRMLEKLDPSVISPADRSRADVAFSEPLCTASAGQVDISDGFLPENLPDTATGVTLLPLAEGIEAYEEKLQRLLTSVELKGAERTFTALNTAFLDQGLVIHVGENVKAGSLLIRWAFSGQAVAQLNNFRMILLLEPGAELEIVEQFESAEESASALNVVTQVDLAEQAVQQMIDQQNLPAIIVNPSTPIGPRDIKPTPTGRMVLDAACGRKPAYVDTGLNLAHVDDVARGHLLAFEQGQFGERYILGGEDMTLQQIFEVISQLSGHSAPKIKLPHNLVLPIAYLSEAWAWLIRGAEPRATVDGVRMSKKLMYFSSDRARRELGYTTRPAHEALADAVDWFFEHNYCAK